MIMEKNLGDGMTIRVYRQNPRAKEIYNSMKKVYPNATVEYTDVEPPERPSRGKSKLGAFLRKLRLRKPYENLTQMARNLGMGTAQLSSLEWGRGEIPKDFYHKVTHFYIMTIGEADELKEAIEHHNNGV